jgi:hypothetical protein
MRRRIGLLWTVGLFSLLSAAHAQAPSSPSTPGTAFDGTYAFVSATKLNETYTTRAGRVGQCGALTAPSLTIVNGQARLKLARGTVGPQGNLAMRYSAPASRGEDVYEIAVRRNIDGAGTVRAGWDNYRCSYAVIWRKVSK